MSRRGCDALAYMSYYREIPEEDGQHAIYARSIARSISDDLPDNLTGKVAHGWSGIQGSTVTKTRYCILSEHLPQGIGEP